MFRKGFRWIPIAVIVVIAIVAGAVWLDRESTLAAAARVAVERSHGALTLEGVSGSLLRRIHIDRAVWRTSSREIEVDDATLAWSPLWVLLATASFHDVRVGDAIVTVADEPAEAMPPSLPASLQLPFRVRIHDTVIDRFAWVRNGKRQEMAQLAIDGEAGWQTWTVTLKESTTPFGTLRAQMEVGASPPYPVNGRLDIDRGGDAPLVLAATASGDLVHTVEVKATLRAQTSAAEAAVVYAPLEAQPILRADATLAALDLRHLIAGAPEAIFDGSLAAAVEDGALRGELRIANRVPGAVDAGRIPLASFAARMSSDADGVAVDGVTADLGDAGTMSGRGRLSASAVTLQLDGQNLNLHGAHSALQPTRFKGMLETRGDVDAQDIRVSLAQPAYRVSFDGTLAADAITVREARVTVGSGFAAAKGSITLDAERRFDLKATLSRFDPSRLGRFKPASLNARIDASGSVQPVVQVRAGIDVAPSTAFGLPTTAKVQWHSRGVDDPQIAIDGSASIGETKVAVKGRLVDPEDLRSLDLTLDLSGPDLAQLYPILGLPFPSTPDYQVAGRLQYDDRVWSFRRFSGRVGRSDLAGDFVVDRRAEKPFMRGTVTSQQLDMRDLSGFIGASDAAPPNPPGRVLPHSEFHVDKLNAANADIRFTGERIRNDTLPLHRMTTHLVLRQGVLTLDPLTFGTAAGDISGRVNLDARAATITAAVDLTGEHVRLERFAPGVKQVMSETGPITGRVRLTMRGNSMAAMLATANGDVALAMSGGTINDLALRLADLDIANALAVMARDRHHSVPVNCLVGELEAQDGVLRPKTLVLDAEHTTATVDGQIDLRRETLDLRVVAKPKQFSVFALRGPIQVSGTLAEPAVRADWKSAIARSGAAVALGVIATPPAAALPFIQLGSAEGFSCAPQVEAVDRFVREQHGATGKVG